MRLGDSLNGYQITSEPTNAGGGMSQWAFAQKDGAAYFVKMFLAPKFPLPEAPGSPEAKQRKLETCMAFEQRHLAIADRIDPSVPGAGNLVVPVAFFRVGATYVKVMDRVNAIARPDAHTLTGKQLLVILRTLTFSLRLLHSKGIVHGDLKPDNVLLEQTGHGLVICKLIDFDEAYLAGSPPPSDQIVGDPSYYSPELLRFIKGHPEAQPGDLATASDMFSLGLLLHLFLVGRLPSFDRAWAAYPCEVVSAGDRLDVSAAPEPIRGLLSDLLAPVAVDRPTIDDVIDLLAGVDGDALVPSGPPPPDLSRRTGEPIGLRSLPRPSVASAPTMPSSPSPSPSPSPTPTPTPTITPAPGTRGGPGLRNTMGRRRSDGPQPEETP